MIFHEAPHKLKATLEDMKNTFGGERKISLCRELTKKNEEVLRFTLESAVDYYNEVAPRGEYVLIVEGKQGKIKSECFFENMSINEHVEFYISNGLSKMDAIKACAKDRGVHKNIVYKEICN
jgi:16S rRNA (cytidine1402-2'-O)-methyltransferase